jgi:putative DNA primase/helicase
MCIMEQYWKKMDKASMISFLGKVAKKTGLVWSMHMDYQFKDQLYKQFVSSGHLQVPSSSREMETLINLKNGTYHVSSTVNRLMSFESSDFITHQLQFCHDGNAKCSKFEQFLNQVLPDLSSQLVLAEFIASTFISQKFLKLEKALILYGAGANGKSVIFDIIVALLGRENVSSYSLGSLTNESGYHRAEIANKLLNYASEIHGKMQSDIFKQLVSGEPIEARSPYAGRPHIIEDYAKFMFNGNELPAEVEQNACLF